MRINAAARRRRYQTRRSKTLGGIRSGTEKHRAKSARPSRQGARSGICATTRLGSSGGLEAGKAFRSASGRPSEQEGAHDLRDMQSARKSPDTVPDSLRRLSRWAQASFLCRRADEGVSTHISSTCSVIRHRRLIAAIRTLRAAPDAGLYQSLQMLDIILRLVRKGPRLIWRHADQTT